MSIKHFAVSIATTIAMATICSIPSPVVTLAGSQTRHCVQSYSASDVQDALRESIENYYYVFKDQPVEHPKHKVSQVKVLHYTQHGRKILLVGSCLVDDKKHIITGVLGKNEKTGKMTFSGTWKLDASVSKPLLWGMNGNRREMYVSGMVINKLIKRVRLTPLPNGRSVFARVTPMGYFTAVVPMSQDNAYPAYRVSIVGLSSKGKVIYSSVPTKRTN